MTYSKVAVLLSPLCMVGLLQCHDELYNCSVCFALVLTGR